MSGQGQNRPGGDLSLLIDFDSRSYGGARNVYVSGADREYQKVRRVPLGPVKPLRRREFGKVHLLIPLPLTSRRYRNSPTRRRIT